MERAVLLVVSLPNIVNSRAIIQQAKRNNQKLRVIARISDPDFFAAFKELGVGDLIYPEFEASLEMIREVLLFQRVPVPEIQRHTETLRGQMLAREIDSDECYATLGQLRASEQQFDLQWVELTEDSPLSGQSLGEADVRRCTGVSVVGIIRQGQLTTNPAADFRFDPGDLVAIIGSNAARQKFHCFLNPSSDLCLRPEN